MYAQDKGSKIDSLIGERYGIQSFKKNSDTSLDKFEEEIGKDSDIIVEDSSISQVLNQREQAAQKKKNSKSLSFCSKKVCGFLVILALITTAVAIYASGAVPSLHTKLSMRCQQYEILKDDQCVRHCTEGTKLYWNRVDRECQDIPFWIECNESGKCVNRCPLNKSFNRYNGACINMYDLFDQQASYLQTHGLSTRLIGSMRRSLGCKGQQYTTIFSNKQIKLKNYIYVQLKTRLSKNGYQSFYYQLKMLMSVDNYKILQTYVDTNDTETIQCQSVNSSALACFGFWNQRLDFYFWQDQYSIYDDKWITSGFAELNHGHREGFARFVNSDNTFVEWYKDGHQDGKQLEYFKKTDECKKIYYENGDESGTWQGTDLQTQYGRD